MKYLKLIIGLVASFLLGGWLSMAICQAKARRESQASDLITAGSRLSNNITIRDYLRRGMTSSAVEIADMEISYAIIEISSIEHFEAIAQNLGTLPAIRSGASYCRQHNITLTTTELDGLFKDALKKIK